MTLSEQTTFYPALAKPIAADSPEMQEIVKDSLETFSQKDDFIRYKDQEPFWALRDRYFIPDSRQKDLWKKLQLHDLVVFGVKETKFFRTPSLNHFHFKVSTYYERKFSSLERINDGKPFSASDRVRCKNFVSEIVLENFKRKQKNQPLIQILFLLNVWKGPEQDPWTTAKTITGSELRRFYKLTTINPTIAELVEQNILFAYPYVQQADPISYQVKMEGLNLICAQFSSFFLLSLPFMTREAPWQTEEWKSQWSARKNPQSHTHWKWELLESIARFKEQSGASSLSGFSHV